MGTNAQDVRDGIRYMRSVRVVVYASTHVDDWHSDLSGQVACVLVGEACAAAGHDFCSQLPEEWVKEAMRRGALARVRPASPEEAAAYRRSWVGSGFQVKPDAVILAADFPADIS